MTDRKISGLDTIAGSSVDVDADFIEIVDSSETQAKRRNKKITPAELVAQTSVFTQSGSGGSSRTVQAKLREIALTPQDFGAVGDGSTDDLAKLNLAETAAIAAGVPLRFPATSSGYAISAQWAVASGLDIIMDPGAFILYTGSTEEAAVLIGDGTLLFQRTYVLDVRRNTQSDWSNTDNVAIKVRNAANCYITIRSARNSTVGFQAVAGSGERFAYNQIWLDNLTGNKYQVNLHSEAANGFLNENIFYGGKFTHTSGTKSGTSRYGIWLSRETGGYSSHNNNRFIGPSFELSQTDAGAGEAIPVLCDVGQNNYFLLCRSEGNHTTYFAREGADAVGRNEYRISYKDSGSGREIDYDGTPRASYIEALEQGLLRKARTIWASGHIPSKTVVRLDGSNYEMNVAGMHIAFSSSATRNLVLNNSTTNPKPTAEYLELATTRAIGVLLDVRACKRFVFRRALKSGQLGRLGFRCYDGHPDSGGVVLTGTPSAADDNVRGVFTTDPTYGTTYGGIYSTGSDSASDVAFSFGTSVEYVAVLVIAGTNAAHIASLEIAALDDLSASVEPGHYLHDNENYLSAEPDTLGTYVVGKRVWDSSPASAAAPGWICTQNGTFSSATDNTGDTDGSTGVITGMTDTSDFNVGDFVSVSAGFASTGPFRITAITATTITVNANSNSSQSNVTVASSDPVFTAMAVLA